jgi:hypothetical protein
MINAEQAAEEDLIIGKLSDLSKEIQAEGNSLKLKLKNASAAVDPLVASALKNLFSMLTDLSQYTLQAHSETFMWAGGVDNDIEELKGDEPTTQFLPEDALRLKSLLLALSQEVRPPTDAEDDVPAALGKQVAEAILFIDEHTLEVEEDDEEEADDEAGEGDDEEGDDE